MMKTMRMKNTYNHRPVQSPGNPTVLMTDGEALPTAVSSIVTMFSLISARKFDADDLRLKAEDRGQPRIHEPDALWQC